MTTISETVSLYTFPDRDKNYCHKFVVYKDDLSEWLNGQANECRTVREYLDTYTWDETYFLYLAFTVLNKIIEESEVK